MRNFFLELPKVPAIKYDGSEKAEKEIREFLLDTVVPITDNSGNKALLLQLEPTSVSLMQISDYLFKEPITEKWVIMSEYDFESLAVGIS